MSEEDNAGQWRLYADLAWLWPVISPPADYERDANDITALLREHVRRDLRTVLDLGCGGGHVDYWLKRHFTVVGIDQSEAMLALACELNPEATYLRGDLRDPPTAERFDAVFLGDAVNYMLSEGDLRQAFQAAYDCLAPGGVFLTVAEETRERFTAPRAHVSHHDSGRIHVTFIENYHDSDAIDTTYEVTLLFLIYEGDRLTVAHDRHRGGVFPLATWHAAAAGVGFEVRETTLRSAGVPAIIGVRPPASDTG
ncbi:MAG: class I SAM-dependent methyltransferase [Planctomycetota bacterium]